MPDPISSPNISYYDPSKQFTPADGSSQSTAAPSAPANTTPAAPATGPGQPITLPEVVIVGDAGAKKLVTQHDEVRRSRSCVPEILAAAVACAKAAASVVVESRAPVRSLVTAGASVAADGAACGEKLRNLYDCKTK